MKKKRRKLRINRVIILLLFVFMICFGVILFIRSNFFSLKNIKIVNNDILTKTEVKNLSNINTGKNLFSYDIEKIKTNINKSKYIEYVKVKRRIPNSIIIDVKEKPIGCVLKDKGDNYYYVSENLCYMDKVERENIKSNCIIVESDFSIKENQIKFENNKDKEKLTSLIKYIKKDGLENKISSISFNSENKVNMTTKEGIEIVINSNSDIKHDIAKLTQILVDLKSKNINYGKINMTFSKYTLYTYK